MSKEDTPPPNPPITWPQEPPGEAPEERKPQGLPEPPTQVDPKAIQDILDGKASGTPEAPDPDMVPLDLDEETIKELGFDTSEDGSEVGADAVVDTPTARKESPLNPTFEPGTNPSSREVLDWIMQTPDLGPIVVSEEEKDAYWRTMLHDEALVLAVDVEAGERTIRMTFNSMNNLDKDVVFQALELDDKDGFIAGTASYSTRLQYYCMARQLASFDDKVVEQFTLQDRPDGRSIKEHRDLEGERLREFVQEHIAPIQAPKWALMTCGIRIFERKIKICNDALMNRDFWQPADTGSTS